MFKYSIINTTLKNKPAFKRNWKYIDDQKNNQHIFWLVDPTLGKYNNLQLEFYNKK